MKGETEEEFHIRIEKEVVKACLENPGVDPEMLRQQMVFMERLHKLEPIHMAKHILNNACSYSDVLQDPETDSDTLRKIAGHLILSVTALSKRLQLLAEETQSRIHVTGNDTVN